MHLPATLVRFAAPFAASLALAALTAPAIAAPAADPTYPTRSIRMVLGFAPGGALDTTARILSRKLGEAMGQTWVVDNRPGAGGNLAGDIVARAPADGYTVLLAVDSQLTMNPTLTKMQFDVENDLQPVTMLATVDQLLLVNPAVPAKSLDELIALAKQNPGKLNYASSAVGSSLHIGGELLKKRAGIDMVHVPYKGGGPAAAALISGEVQVMMGSLGSTIGHVKAGRVRAIASTGAKRSRVLPDLPTIAESGYPGFQAEAWFALMLPAGTPPTILERIRNETLKVLQDTEVQASMAANGLNQVTSTPAELAARIKADTAQWAAVIKDAGIRLE
jgi:tripartite-type tricarboxylate transporter receptor subunit TctC